MNRRPPHQPKRAFAAFLAAMTLTVQGPGLYAQETSLWQSRRDNARRWRSENAPTPAPEALPLFAKLPGASPVVMGGSSGASLEKLDWLSTLVAGNGWVREAHVSPRPGAPLIVHIQDAHGIEDAQRNIAALVARLSEATPETPIALEGAAGPIDVAGLRAFPDAALTKNIADFLLHRGLIAGPEHAALTTARPLPLTGAEDPELYLKNVAVFREARSRTADRRDRLGRFQERLDRAEETRASPALREFHRRSRDHDEGRVPLADYLGYLTGAVPPGDGPKSPNIDALLKAVRAEKTLDFKAVEAARRRLVDALVDRLPRPALARVLSDGLDVRAGRMSAGRYHDRLRATARAHGVDPRDFGPLPAYIDYVSLADTIDRAALLDEISDRRRRVEDALARTPAERALVELARDTALLGKALNHTLAPVDWRAYAARRPAFQTLSARLEALDGKTDAEFIPLDLKPFEDFCELAIRRNEALSRNLLAARAATGADRAVLIAGGFHTDGLTALWRQQQLSYVVVAPAMRDIPTDNPYLDILAHDPLPIEKMVAGERVYLSRPIALAASGPVRDFYLAMQRLLQNGLQVAAAAGVTVSRAPLRGGVAFRVGAVELHARFSDAAKTWAARWRNNFDPGPNAVGGMMFWLPRLWNASTPKPFHISAARYRGVSVPAEAGLAGLAALGITTALGLPGDFDLFVRLSLAAYAVLHLGDFLTRDRRRAELNAGLAAGLATVAGLFMGVPADWMAVIGLTPAQAAYGAFIALHAGVNLLVVRFPRVGRPAPPAMLSPPSLPAFAPTAFESSPNAVFRDRRAPISPPADAPVTDRQATLPQPLPRTAPDVPPVVAPRPALPRRAAAAPTAEILKERLATALFSLARPLSRKSLVDFRVRNLRLQADAFPGTSPYYHRLTSAWEKGVERTVLLTSWGPLRSVRIPLEDLPLPIVVQGLHLLLESREGVPALLFPNGKYIAPLDREDPRPMVFGREILAQATGTPVFELMDYSQNHFRFWRDGNDVVVEDLSTNGTVVPIRQTDGVPYDERTQFAGTVDGTRFHSTRRAQLFGFLMAGLLLTALLAAPLDVSAATLVTLDGGGLKALVERGDTLWGILDFAEGGGAAELVVRVKEIARLNNLSNPHLIFPGQEILLRAAVETAPAVTDTVAAATAPAPVLAPTVVSQAGDVMFVGLRVANVLLMTLAALALAGGAVAAALRRKSFPPPSTTFLSSDIDWSGAAEFQESPVVARPAPPAVPQVRSTLPWLLTSIAAARWARRALPRALNATWRSPARFALWVGTTANNGFHWLAATPTRLRTRSEKRRAAYDDPSTFFAHTRTGFEDPAGPAPARAPTRMRRWAATLYGWLNRSPLAFREVRAVPVDQITDDRLPVVAATDAREVLAIGPEDRALGEYTVEPPPLIEAPGPDFTLDAIENMPDGLIETAAPLYAADRALNRQTGLLAEEWRDQGLFDLPPSLVTYGDGENILMEIPFPKAAVRAIHRRLAAHRWLGLPLGNELGAALPLLNKGGWLRRSGESPGADTPARFPLRLAALFKGKIAGGVMHDEPKEKLLVNLPAEAAWPFFFKMWWRGTREGYPPGVGLTPRQEQAFFGGETLRFPSGEPLVTQVEVAWGIDGSLGPENIHLGNLDAVADYVLLHFDPRELAALADRPNENPEAARADLIAALRQDVRQRVAAAFASASSRAIALGAPTGVGLEMNLALSWKMTEDGATSRARLVPQIVSLRTSLNEAAARAPRRAPTAVQVTARPAPPAPAFWAGLRPLAAAVRTAAERLPFVGRPLTHRPWLIRLAAPFLLAFVLIAFPVLSLGQAAPRAAWTPSEAVLTNQIPPNVVKELSKSLPPGTDMTAVLRGTDPGTSARLLANAVELLRKFEGGRFLTVLEQKRPHVVLAPKGPEAAAAVEFKTGRPAIYIGGADGQPAYLFVALVHELSHLERSAQLRSKKITRTQDEGMALEDTARAMEFYAGLSVVRIAYDQYQINEQRWIAHRFLDGTVTAAPHVLSPKEAQLITAPLRAAMRLAEQRRYPGAVYVSSKNLGGGRYEVRFRVPPRGAEIVVDVTPQRVSAVPGGTEVGLAMIAGIVFRPRTDPETGDDGTNPARAALLRTLLLGEAGPVRFDVPARAFKDGDNYWGANDLEDLRRRVAAASDERAAEGFVPALQLLAADAATARDLIEGRGTAGDIEAFALREAGAAAAREANARGETTLHVNLLGFGLWEPDEKEKTRLYLAGLVAALKPGATVVVAVDQPGPLADLWSDAARRGLRVRPVTPAQVPGVVNGAGQLVLSVLVDWIERVNAAGTEPPIGRGSRVIARNDEAVVPLEGFVIIGVARLSAAIAREIENLRTILTQA